MEKAYQLLAPASRPASIQYRSKVEQIDGQNETAEFFEAALLDALARRRDAEIERGVCLVGPHRDDLELRLGDQVAKGFASHGESWSMALALRLAAYELLRAEAAIRCCCSTTSSPSWIPRGAGRWPVWRLRQSRCW